MPGAPHYKERRSVIKIQALFQGGECNFPPPGVLFNKKGGRDSDPAPLLLTIRTQIALTGCNLAPPPKVVEPASGEVVEPEEQPEAVEPASGEVVEPEEQPEAVEPASGEVVELEDQPEVTYTLSLTVNPSYGSISLSPAGGTYTSGTQVTLTAVPLSGYQFTHWSGDVSSTSPTITITVDSSKSVTANFKQTWVCPYGDDAEFDTMEELNDHIRSEHPEERQAIDIEWDVTYYTLNVTINPGGGGVSLSPYGGTYGSGSRVTLTAVPSPGYRFTYWSGDIGGTSPVITILMNGNFENVTANFEKIPT